MSKNKSNTVNSDTVDTSIGQSVIIEKLESEQGAVGVLTLNTEKTLNSLSLEMVRALTLSLTDWENDSAIKAVILKGAGSRAFCAGGDVQALYESATHQEDGEAKAAETFFLEEYQLNYLIHCYDKPIVCIGHGVVMGGGLGLMAGASHRVVTDSTRMAMPEITIGLFPDVGGTYFLNQVPYNLGYFLAITGVPLNAADAYFCHLADYIVDDARTQALISSLSSLAFDNDDNESNHTKISECIRQFESDKKSLKPSQIKQNLSTLEAVCRQNSLCALVNSIKNFDDDNPFLAKSKSTLSAGSPLSLALIFEQLKRHRYLDLQSIFKSELILATNMVRHPEFAEGVRALLIDKDKSPKWCYPSTNHIPCSVIDQFFTPPWQVNPLEGKLT